MAQFTTERPPLPQNTVRMMVKPDRRQLPDRRRVPGEGRRATDVRAVASAEADQDKSRLPVMR